MKSRGLGQVQTAIIEVLERDGALPFASIAWRAAEHMKAIGPGDDLAPEIYSPLHRAAIGLAGPKHRRVVRSRAVFQWLDQFVLLYAEHTKAAAIRDLRRALLPHVEGFVHSLRKRLRRTHECEDIAVGALADAERRALGEAWLTAERALLDSVGALPSEGRVVICETVARGREVLLNAPRVNCSFSLFGALKAVEALPLSSPVAPGALATLRSLMPREAFEHQRLKAILFPVVDLTKRQRATLKKEFKKHLLDVKPTYVASLPGHVPASPRDPSMWDLLRGDDGPTYSPILDRLILHNVHKQFWVYRLASEPEPHPIGASPSR